MNVGPRSWFAVWNSHVEDDEDAAAAIVIQATSPVGPRPNPPVTDTARDGHWHWYVAVAIRARRLIGEFRERGTRLSDCDPCRLEVDLRIHGTGATHRQIGVSSSRLARLRDVVDRDPSGLIDDDGFQTRLDNLAGGETYLIAQERDFNGFATTDQELGNEWMVGARPGADREAASRNLEIASYFDLSHDERC